MPLDRSAWQFAVAVVCLLILLGSSFFLRGLDEKKIAQRPLGRRETARTIVLGDSQMAMIPEAAFGETALNMSQGGCTYSVAEALLRHHAGYMPNLRNVVLELDNLMLRKDEFADRKGDFRELTALGLPWWKVPSSWVDRLGFAFRYNPILKPLCVGPKVDLDYFERALAPREIHAATQAPLSNEVDVYSRRKSFTFAPVAGREKIAAYLKSLGKKPGYRRNHLAFLGIAAFCREHGLRLRLVRPINTDAYLLHRHEEWKSELLKLVGEAEKIGDAGWRPMVWAPAEDLRFALEEFEDPNHLKAESAARVGELLARWIEEGHDRDDRASIGDSPTSGAVALCDPREDAWRWDPMPAATGRVGKIPAPDGAPLPLRAGFQLSFLAGDRLTFSSGLPAARGELVHSRAWLWKNADDESGRLKICLRDDSKEEVATLIVEGEQLSARPAAFELEGLCASGSDDLRLVVEMQGGHGGTVCFGGGVIWNPSLQRQSP